MTALFQSWGASFEWAWFWSMLIGILAIALPLMLAVAMIIYAERKIWAAIALRRGPNVVGPWGLLQSFADGLKVFLKETIIPTSANKGLFLIAPIITFTVALIVWAVVPFDVGVVLADINVGLLYVLAASSLGVYGVILAGWASNSKYPFFSAIRAAAQMVSYEVSIGFVLISVVLYANSFNLTAIVMAQQGNVLGLLNGFGFNPLLFPMAVVFLISSMAETFRTPFDRFDQLRAAMVKDFPELGIDGVIGMKWSPPKLDSKAEGPVTYPIKDFYLTNAICRASPTLRRCSEELVQGVPYMEAAE